MRTGGLSLVAVVLVALAAGCAAATPDNGHGRASVATAAEAAGAALTGFEVVEADETPSLRVGGEVGYRVVLRQTSWLPKEWTQFADARRAGGAGRYPVYDCAEVILVPGAVPDPHELLARMPWQDLDHLYYLRPTWAGRGMGFSWFCNMTIPIQHILRGKLGLEGGEDRIALLIEGLAVSDRGGCTPNSCAPMIGMIGEPALPYVRRAIQQNSTGDPWRAVQALAGIRGAECTQLLRELYFSGDEKLSRAAAYALMHKPYREAARDAYLDMLRKQRYVRYVCEACVQFDWPESVPALEKILEAPNRVWDYEPTYRALRTFQGNPFPEEIAAARGVVRNYFGSPDAEIPAEVAAAVQAIIDADDRPAAAVAGVTLALTSGKAGPAGASALGHHILEALPREVVLPLLEVITRIPEDSVAMHDLQRLEAELEEDRS